MTGDYCEVRQAGDELEAIGIPQGAAVALRVGPDLDYESGDVVLVRVRGESGVGCLMVFEGVTEDGAGVRLSTPGSGIDTYAAHRIELRGRGHRHRQGESWRADKPKGLTPAERYSLYCHILNFWPGTIGDAD